MATRVVMHPLAWHRNNWSNLRFYPMATRCRYGPHGFAPQPPSGQHPATTIVIGHSSGVISCSFCPSKTWPRLIGTKPSVPCPLASPFHTCFSEHFACRCRQDAPGFVHTCAPKGTKLQVVSGCRLVAVGKTAATVRGASGRLPTAERRSPLDQTSGLLSRQNLSVR